MALPLSRVAGPLSCWLLGVNTRTLWRLCSHMALMWTSKTQLVHCSVDTSCTVLAHAYLYTILGMMYAVCMQCYSMLTLCAILNQRGWSALHKAASWNRKVATVEALVAAGADMNILDEVSCCVSSAMISPINNAAVCLCLSVCHTRAECKRRLMHTWSRDISCEKMHLIALVMSWRLLLVIIPVTTGMIVCHITFTCIH